MIHINLILADIIIQRESGESVCVWFIDISYLIHLKLSASTAKSLSNKIQADSTLAPLPIVYSKCTTVTLVNGVFKFCSSPEEKCKIIILFT